MKYRKLFPLVFFIGLLGLGNANGQPPRWRSRPRGDKPRQTEARRAIPKKTNEVEFDLCYSFYVPGKTSKIELVAVLPRTIPHRQQIYNMGFSPAPSRVFSKNKNDYAEFVFIKPQKQFKVKINVKAKLLRYDLVTARTKAHQEFAEDPNLSDFLKQEKHLEKDHPRIREIVKSIRGQEEIYTVRNIYNYVINSMEYTGYNRKSLGAIYAAEHKKGDCSEYSDLFVALCRAKAIPARVVTGYTTESKDTPKHAWPEIYLKKYGWVPFDLTKDGTKNMSTQKFQTLQPTYIYFTHMRNDDVIADHSYATWWWWGDKIKVEESIEFKQRDGAKRKRR